MSDPSGTAAGRVQYAPRYRNYVLAVLLLAYIVNVMDRAVLGVLIQSIKIEFSATDTQLGLLGGLAFALFYSTLGIPIALWADRSSRRNVLALAVGLWSTMTALCGAATSFASLVLFRIGTAVGEAGVKPSMVTFASTRPVSSTRSRMGFTVGASAGIIWSIVLPMCASAGAPLISASDLLIREKRMRRS